jgi:8-oxo-dGTP diphosphatase
LFVNLAQKVEGIESKTFVQTYPPMSPRTVLITGFEPFGGHAENISAEVAQRLLQTRQITHPWSQEPIEVDVTVDVLTVDGNGARTTARRWRDGQRFDAVLHLGLCERCEVPQIELLARDRLDMRISDNLGRQVREHTLDGGGDRGTWVDPSIWPRTAFNVPFHLSKDAGSFVCNETYFETLKALSESETGPLPPPCMFVHLPDKTRLDVAASTIFVEKVLAFLLHPTPTPPVRVVAAYLPGASNRHLIAKRARGEQDAGEWEFPGGKLEHGESWKEAIERELQEELNLTVSARHLLGCVVRTVGSTLFSIHLVQCDWAGEVKAEDLLVHDALDWVDQNDRDRLWAGRDAYFHALVNELSHNQVDASPSSAMARSSLMDRGT